jgi:serine phosphatase RsbU (regulator of sigma subunit)
MNGEGRMFRTDGIGTVLAGVGRETCEHLCDAVMKCLGQFVGGAPQNDDITMLAISYRGPGAEYRDLAA